MTRVLLEGMNNMTRKAEGPKTLGSYKSLGVTPPVNVTAETVCFICGDTASKRRVRNPCACQTHREYLR